MSRKYRRTVARRDARCVCIIASIEKALAMKFVGAVAGNDVHRSGGSKLGRDVQTGLADLKLIDRARRNILRGGPHRFIADINAIDFNARRAPKASAK